tara:strand:- start:117 stop:536 length:420 start_codon:yes stop_codon:yes gene_type:complete
MDKESYYASQTDRQRLANSQRKVMSLESKITELQDEIVRITLKIDELADINKDLSELRLSQSNETEIQRQDNYNLKLQVLDLQEELEKTKSTSREQIPFYMLNILEGCYTHILDTVTGPKIRETLLKDLRTVINFLDKE